MEEFFATILKPLLFGLPPVLVLVIILLFFPEKIEKWSALLWKLMSFMGGLFRFARKRYIKHDLQGRVNDFVSCIFRLIPATHSAPFRPPIPEHSGHLFRNISATL